MHEILSETLDRRSFLRSTVGVAMGVGLGLAITPPLADRVNDATEEMSGHPTGNASWDDKVTEECADEDDPKTCEDEYELTTADKVSMQITAPITEEIIFRAVPSVALDTFSEEDYSDDPEATVVGGTEDFSFTRNELIVGAVSSVVFGLAHNLTGNGFDTKTIPASQTVDGFLYWVLMRRFGIASSMASHAAFNTRAVQASK